MGMPLKPPFLTPAEPQTLVLVASCSTSREDPAKKTPWQELGEHPRHEATPKPLNDVVMFTET